MNTFEYNSLKVGFNELEAIINEPMGKNDEKIELSKDIMNKKICSCEKGGYFVIHPLYLVDKTTKRRAITCRVCGSLNYL